MLVIVCNVTDWKLGQKGPDICVSLAVGTDAVDAVDGRWSELHRRTQPYPYPTLPLPNPSHVFMVHD